MCRRMPEVPQRLHGLFMPTIAIPDYQQRSLEMAMQLLHKGEARIISVVLRREITRVATYRRPIRFSALMTDEHPRYLGEETSRRLWRRLETMKRGHATVVVQAANRQGSEIGFALTLRARREVCPATPRRCPQWFRHPERENAEEK